MTFMLCYDDTSAATAALEEARKQARVFNADVLIVTSFVTEDRFHEKDITAAKVRLKEAQELFEKDGIACRTILSIRGLEAGEDLVMTANENNVAQIFIGIRHRSKVGKLLMGSVLQHVLLTTDCPVLAVKPK